MISFHDSFISKGHLPFVLYFDFETTAPTDNIFDPEQKKMFVVSYVLIVAFHQALNLNRIIIQRSYSHSLEELTTIKYLNNDQIKFIDLQILNQLKDIAIDVSKRKCKNAMGQMFCVETAFVKNTLLEWFNKKFKLQNLEIPALMKMIYEQKNSIDWKKDKCVICKMPLKIEPTSFKMPGDEMSYGDFFIQFEHKFIRNIFTNEKIQESDDLNCLENYYKTYQKFISISIDLLSLFNNYPRIDELNNETSEFIEESFANDTIDELKVRVIQTEIKNALKTSFDRVPKFNLKIYAFDYDWLVYFPKSGI